jgi:transposase InsO family protein
MGLISSADVFNRATDDIILPSSTNVYKLVDDVLIWGENYEELFLHLEKVLKACADNNITLKKSKFEIGTSVTFSGFIVSADGIQPTPERIECIQKFPTPSTRTELKSFLGIARYIGHMVPDLAMAEGDMRHLDKNKTAFVWTACQAAAFEKVKEILRSPLVLKNFDSTKETRLETDASRTGLGFALMQQDPKTKHWHLVYCGSRQLTSAEANYSVCALELLGCTYALQKCRHYLIGFDGFTVLTDHSALCGLFQKDLSELTSPRLQRLREKCTEFSFKVDWRKGAANTLADALSRYPIWPADHSLEDENDEHICAMIQNPIADPLLDPMIKEAEKCKEYMKIKSAIQQYKNPDEIPRHHIAKSYSKVWRNLSIHTNGLIVLDLKRIVVPKNFRDQILAKIHTAHCGENKSIMLGKQLFYWPQISNNIRQTVAKCVECRRLLPSQHQEPVKANMRASYPMQDVSTDLMSIEKNDYLAMVDRYSGWAFCEKLKTTTSEAVTRQLTKWYSTFGFPARQMSDQGPQYTSEWMDAFCEEHNIKQEFSSPGHAQSNGLAEASVKNLKHLLIKVEEKEPQFQLALQAYRNTPSHTGYSPSQLFLCRPTRSDIPILPEMLEINPENAILGNQEREKQHQKLCDQKSGKELPQLEPGDRVLVQQLRGIGKRPRWDNAATVISRNPSGFSYIIQLDTGEQFSRNRVYLRKLRLENPAEESEPEAADTNAAPRRSSRLAIKNQSVFLVPDED